MEVELDLRWVSSFRFSENYEMKFRNFNFSTMWKNPKVTFSSPVIYQQE